MPHKDGPREPAGTTGARRINGYTNSRDSKRLPPFGKSLTPSMSKTIWVCVGSEAWERGNSETWFKGSKVVLPPGDDPATFRWGFVTGFGDVAVIADGIQPDASIITALARELLVFVGSVLFLPVDRHPVRFSAQQRRAA